MKLTLQQQINLWSQAAEGLLDDISNQEFETLGKDIAENAEKIWTYYEIISADAERLSKKAREYADTARLQKNKAERTKEFLKYCLKTNGFTKLKIGALQMSLVDVRKDVVKRQANESDFFANPFLVKSKFSWKSEPNEETWTKHADLVDPTFEFDIDSLKKAGRDDLIGSEISTRLHVKIAREK